LKINKRDNIINTILSALQLSSNTMSTMYNCNQCNETVRLIHINGRTINQLKTIHRNFNCKGRVKNTLINRSINYKTLNQADEQYVDDRDIVQDLVTQEFGIYISFKSLFI
jgi:hypothetical protein